MFDSPYDIEIDNGNIGLMIASPPTVGPKFTRTYQGIAQPEVMTYSNWNLGQGFDDFHEDGGYGWGENCSTRHRGVVTAAGYVTEPLELPGNPIGLWGGMFTYQNDLYLVGGSNVYQVVNGNPHTGIGLAHSPTAAATTSLQYFNPTKFGTTDQQAGVYIGIGVVGPSGAPWGLTRFNGVTWTDVATDGFVTTPGGLNTASVYWDTNGAQGQRLIMLDGYNSFRTLTSGTADPMLSASWSSQILVGERFYAIRSIAGTSHHVYFCTQGGVRDVDARLYTPNITPYFEEHYDYDNGRVSHFLDGYLYVSYARGLTRIPLNGLLQQGPEPCHPSASLSSRSPIFGQCTALTDYQGWLVGAFYNPLTNKSYICWGKDKERTQNAKVNGPLEWHGAEAVIDGKVEKLMPHSPNTTPSAPATSVPKLWILGNNNGIPFARYQWLHQSESYYQDYKQNTGTQFAPYWELNLADGLPNARTLFRVPWEYELETENLSNVSRIHVNVSADSAANTLEGTFYTSPRARIPAGAHVKSATRMEFNIVANQYLVGTSSISTPIVLRGLRVPCSLHGQKFEVRSYPVGLARGQALKNHTADTQDPVQVTADLLALHSETANIVNFKDDTGEYNVEVMSSDDSDNQERHGDYEQNINLVVRIINTVARYDSSQHYDDSVQYG